MNESIDVESLMNLITTKIPIQWEQVDNRLLTLRYLQKCTQIKNWLLEKYGNRKKFKILDFGCGHGHTVIVLKSMGFDVTGIDTQRHQYWDNIDADLLTYDGTNLPFRPSEFDAIVLFGVLEHIGNYPRDPSKFEEYQMARRTCLVHLYNILQNKGLLFVYDFPNKYSPIEMVNELFNLPFHHDKTDKQSLKQVRSLVSESGYILLKTGRMGVLPAYFGNISPFIKNNIINKHYKLIGEIDYGFDKLFGNLMGQSNYVIAQKAI